jgi:hypothetical protein
MFLESRLDGRKLPEPVLAAPAPVVWGAGIGPHKRRTSFHPEHLAVLPLLAVGPDPTLRFDNLKC